MSHETLFQQTQQALEWPRLLELLASHAHSSLGADYCRFIPLAESYSSAQGRIHETVHQTFPWDAPNLLSPFRNEKAEFLSFVSDGCALRNA